MARPLRRLYSLPTSSRRRHRTWMTSMTLAMLGSWTWATAVAWDRLAPGTAPGLVAVFTVSSLFTIPGLMLGLLTLRARLGWLVIAAVPIAANLILLVLPPVVIAMRAPPGP